MDDSRCIKSMLIMVLLHQTMTSTTGDQTATRARISASTNPRITEHPEDQYVAKNEPATLNCKAEGDPTPVITWYRNGQPVVTANENPSSHRMLLPSGQLFFLRIIHNKNSRSDVGVYHCNATNPQSGLSVVSRNATLQIATLGSEFGEQPGNTEAVSGEDVTLPCAAPRGEPAPRVRWSKNNAPLKPDTDRVSVLQSGSLRLRDVRRQDAGNYVCIAYNIGGERNSNAARLTVREPPQIVEGPKDVVVQENADVTFQCQADGDPQPTIIWKKLDGRMPKGRVHIEADRSLKIERVRLSDAGMYLCHAENSVSFVEASAKLIVHSQPSFLVTPQDQVVTVGRRVVMRCKVTGNPVPAVFWNKQASEVLMFPNQDHGRITVTEEGSLVIESVEQQDGGEYICKGLSAAGSAYAKAKLQVRDVDSRPPPIIYHGPQNQTLPVNSVATLSCSASGEPSPVISWYRNHRVIPPHDHRFTILQSGALQITDLRKSDSGLYTCKATSETGQSTWNAFLVVETSSNPRIVFHRTPEPSAFPGPPSKPDVQDMTETSVRLTWRANSNHGASPVVAFTVEYFSHETGQGWIIAADDVQNEFFTVRDLRPDTAYMFLVRAQNSHGLSLPSHVTSPLRTAGVDGSKSRVSLDSASDKLSSSQLVHLNTPQPISSTAVKLSWFVRRHQRYIQGFVVKHRPLLGNDDDRASGHVTEVRVAGGDVTSYTLEGLDKYTWYEVSIQPFFRSVIGRQSSAQVRTLDDVPSAPPANIKATMVDNTTMYLTWEPPPPQQLNGPLLGYKIYMYNSESRTSREISLNSSLEAIYVHHMLTETTYTIQMSAVTRAGEGVRSQLIVIGAAVESAKPYIGREAWFIATLIGAIGSLVWLAVCILAVFICRRCRRCRRFNKASNVAATFYSTEGQRRFADQQASTMLPIYLQKGVLYSDQCNGCQQTVSTLTRAGAADQSSVSGAGTAHYGRPASASADQSTSTDLISTELLSPDLTSACPDASAAVFRPIRRPYGTISSQDEDFSYFDTDDDDDDDHLRYNDAGVAYVQRQPILFLPPPPSNPPPRDLITPPRSTPSRSGRHRRVARDARSRDSVELDLPYGRSPSPRATWSHVTCVEPRSLYSPHAMSEPGCMTSSDRVTDDVMAGGRGGSFDLSEIRHYSDTDGVLLVDQSALLHHEFSPPSPAPQDALSHTASSVNNDSADEGQRSRPRPRPLPTSSPGQHKNKNKHKMQGSNSSSQRRHQGRSRRHHHGDSDVNDDELSDVDGGRQRHGGSVRETADREVTSMDTDMDIIESSHRPSGTSSQSRGSDVSKPPPIAAKPRVRNTGGRNYVIDT